MICSKFGAVESQNSRLFPRFLCAQRDRFSPTKLQRGPTRGRAMATTYNLINVGVEWAVQRWTSAAPVF